MMEHKGKRETSRRLPAYQTHEPRIRISVTHWDNRSVYGRDMARNGEEVIEARFAEDGDGVFSSLPMQLYEGAQLNLLSSEVTPAGPGNEEEATRYVFRPELFVLEPDFLIDITALCACMKPYGHSPYTYLLAKFAPAARSATIQMGNAANQFLDDCVNEPETERDADEEQLYRKSMQRSFRHDPLAYSTLPDIGREFFDRCRLQFHHIREAVRHHFHEAGIDVRKAQAQLEPAFLCEALGLQGRMDLLAENGKKLIELKSGKADEYPQRMPKYEHRMQMALYKEVLFYNTGLPREQIQSFLFYSRYPQFYAVTMPRDDIRRAIALRNGILHLERRLREGESRQIVAEMDEAHLNTSGRKDRFYQHYLRPSILEILMPLKQAEGVEAAYFHRFLAFMEREQYLAKAGDAGSFAETWRGHTPDKMKEGNILTGLSLRPETDEEGAVTGFVAELPDYGTDFLPNFRPGDMVMLYEKNEETDAVTQKQFFRCTVEEIRPHQLRLALTYKQRHADVFPAESLYAIEPGYLDATFNQAYRGLFQFLKAPKERRELLLGQRLPESDHTATLHLHHPDKAVEAMLLQAKQANDYFLLVGPPGTGKTSVALKSMVEEFLADTPQKTLLLMAYTNRAVDEICAMLSSMAPTPDYIRIGQATCCAPAYQGRLMQQAIGHARSRREIYERLQPVRVFCGTVSSLCARTELFSLKPIDVALVDEASQVLEPQLLPLLCATTEAHRGDYNLARCAIGKFILIGDHKQLPAVVVQPAEESRVDDPTLKSIGLTNCRNSLFERLHTLARRQGMAHLVGMLHRQGRMHPEISEFVNRKFYGGTLTAVPLPHQQEPLDAVAGQDSQTVFVSGTRIGFFPVKPDKEEIHYKSNPREAETAAQIVRILRDIRPIKGQADTLSRHIGIIVPFRAQIACMRRALSPLGLACPDDLTIDTVERFQGSQRDVIIFSATVCRDEQLALLSEPVTADDGQRVDRKLNVALTRARKQFFLIGCESVLRRCEAYRELLDFIGEGRTFRA